MHHMDTDKALREKAWRELYKTARSYVEQMLEAIPHETIVVQPLTSYQ